MQKINILIIIKDHLGTLVDDRSKKRSWLDVFLFYGIPLVIGTFYFFRPFNLPDAIENSLIAVFSVFGALLFSAQVALYNLSPAKIKETSDPIQQAVEEGKLLKEKGYFRDINYNVSYLILLSCLLLILFISLMVVNLPAHIEGTILVTTVSHFFLSLLMLVKRSHVAFALRHTDDS